MMVWLLNNNELVGDPKDIDDIKALKRNGIYDVDIEFSATRTYKQKYDLMTLSKYILDKHDLLGLDDKIKAQLNE